MNSKNNVYNSIFNNQKIVSLKSAPDLDIVPSTLDRRVLIFADTIMDEVSKRLIDDIMKACNVPYNQYEIIDKFSEWRVYRQFKGEAVLLFGSQEEKLGLEVVFPENLPVRFDGKTWIKTNDIPDLVRNKNLKNQLWSQALKPYFISN